ncbi:MAG TPA: hypothetical protein VFJ09_04555 [Nocardioidaceae bacterium]|nr:hypothetical protein [Nocardioidaceae bacterium]
MPFLRRTPSLSVPCAALLAAAALMLAGCSSGSQPHAAKKTPPPSPSPTSTVSVPAGVSLTDQGSKLSFGDSATVIFEADQDRGTVLKLTAKNATKGRISDLSGFVLDDATRRSTPYYVHVSVSNVGQGDVGGGPVPLYGVDADNTLLPPASFTSPFKPCRSQPLPKNFGPGDSVRTCLVFLAPSHGTLTAVSYRPDQAFDPITWTGQIATEKKH